MITLTTKANNKVRQQIQKRGKGLGIRIGVKTTGCSGLAYVLEFVDSPIEGDIKVDCDGCDLFVDGIDAIENMFDKTSEFDFQRIYNMYEHEPVMISMGVHENYIKYFQVKA